MAERNGLGRLQMGEAGHDRAGIGLGLLGERQLQRSDLAVERLDRGPDIEPEIDRNLIVARARRVQPPGRRAEEIGEPGLDIHMDVFELARDT